MGWKGNSNNLEFALLTRGPRASTTVSMPRVPSEARNQSLPKIPRRGPARAGRIDSDAGSLDPVDVFDRLARSPNLLTAKELADLLAVSPKTIYSHVARNLIPHYKIASSVRFRARDIAEWLRSHAA